jgi:hypothetical protein
MARAGGTSGMRAALLAPLLAALLAGCGLVPAAPPTADGPPVDCGGVPQAACDGIVSQAGQNARGQNAFLVQVRIHCTSPDGCTEASGQVEYEAVLSNGTTFGTGFAWGGQSGGGPLPPKPGMMPPPVPPSCLGVPPGWCRDLAVDLNVGGDPSAVVSIVLRCAAACTETRGEGSTVVTLKDGSTLESGWGYEGAAAP